MGYSEWAGPAEVWASKVLELADVTNDAMRRGIRLEPLILDYVQEELGVPVARDMRFVSTEDPLFAANLDGWVPEKKTVIEVKSTISWDGWGEEGSQDVPPAYYLQVQHQMFCAEAKEAQIWAAIPNMRTVEFDPRMFVIPRDNEVIAVIRKACREFWDKYVLTKTKPPEAPRNSEFWGRIKRVAGAVCELPGPLYTVYCAAVLMAREADKHAQEAKAAVLAAMGDTSVGMIEGRIVVAPESQNRFDSKSFRADNPDLYAKYVKPCEPFLKFKPIKGK